MYNFMHASLWSEHSTILYNEDECVSSGVYQIVLLRSRVASTQGSSLYLLIAATGDFILKTRSLLDSSTIIAPVP